MDKIVITGSILCLSAFLKACYAYKTKFNKIITIDDKFGRIVGNKDGSRHVFCVSTTDGEIFKFTKSLWYWQFYSTEMWSSLKKGHSYEFTGYGWRNGFLSLYPNIVKIREIKL